MHKYFLCVITELQYFVTIQNDFKICSFPQKSNNRFYLKISWRKTKNVLLANFNILCYTIPFCCMYYITRTCFCFQHKNKLIVRDSLTQKCKLQFSGASYAFTKNGEKDSVRFHDCSFKNDDCYAPIWILFWKSNKFRFLY